jgi:hypothetical protein
MELAKRIRALSTGDTINKAVADSIEEHGNEAWTVMKSVIDNVLEGTPNWRPGVLKTMKLNKTHTRLKLEVEIDIPYANPEAN